MLRDTFEKIKRIYGLSAVSYFFIMLIDVYGKEPAYDMVAVCFLFILGLRFMVAVYPVRYSTIRLNHTGIAFVYAFAFALAEGALFFWQPRLILPALIPASLVVAFGLSMICAYVMLPHDDDREKTAAALLLTVLMYLTSAVFVLAAWQGKLLLGAHTITIDIN